MLWCFSSEHSHDSQCGMVVIMLEEDSEKDSSHQSRASLGDLELVLFAYSILPLSVVV